MQNNLEFSEIGIDDFSLDLSDIFSDEELSDISSAGSSIPVIPYVLNYNDTEYKFYMTDSVPVAQLFNKNENLDELAVGYLYLLPEGKQVKNSTLLNKFEPLEEVFLEEQDVIDSRVEDFSNRILRNHLLYVNKRGLF